MPRGAIRFIGAVLPVAILAASAASAFAQTPATAASATPATPGMYEGVDFVGLDQLHVPHYELSRNLVQNPSFEQGLAYWRLGPWGALGHSHLPDYYLVDETTSYKGGRSLKIISEGPRDQPNHLATFSIPAVHAATYTLSFYAKADRPGIVLSSNLGSAIGMQYSVMQQFPLTTDWTRYSVTFKSINNAVAPDFGLDKQPADSVAWVDCVQLERGATMTDYTEKPFGFRLITNARNNLVNTGDPAGANIEISGTPSSSGTVSWTATNVESQVVSQGTSPFTIPAAGRTLVPQPWADQVPTGMYIVEMDVKGADGFLDAEYSRFARMPFLTGDFPNRPFFAIGTDSRTGMWEQRFRFYREIGLGSLITFNPQNTGFRKVYQADGFVNVSSIFSGGDSLMGWDIRHHYRDYMDPVHMAAIEKAAYDKARECPDITYWKLINEPNFRNSPDSAKLVTDAGEMKVYLQVLAVVRKAILRANPNAVILSPDPSDMNPRDGIQWLDTFIKAGGLSVADIIAIHPYRQRPETPDLDADYATLFKVLDADGYHGPVWITEGGGTSNMEIPPYGLDVYKTLGEDNWRGGVLTYDMGWAERLSAAFCEREYLIGLKYQTRIKQDIDWYLGGNAMVDQDMTPGLIAFAPNVLGNLLGDSSFVRDIPLGDQIRSYLFKDGTGRPVAAVWTYDQPGDHGQKTGPTLTLDKLPKGCEAFDMVGAPLSLVTGKITIGPLPVYIRGPVGSVDEVGGVIENAPMFPERSGFQLTAQVTSATGGIVTLENLLRRPLKGTLAISQSGHPVNTQTIDLAGNTTMTAPIDVTEIGHGLRAGITFTPADGGAPQTSTVNVPVYVAHAAPPNLKIDGDLSKWPAADGIPVTNLINFPPPGGRATIPYGGPKDQSATLWTGWDAQNFYVALHVVDDVYHPVAAGPTAYNGDSVQMYIDAYGDARSRKEVGFNGSDEAFILSSDLTTPSVQRTFAPDWQLAMVKTGEVAAAKLVIVKTADGYNVEAAFPAAEIVPMSLKPGSVFGFAVLVNDNDGDYRKHGLTLTPPGTEPFERPDLYPIFVLGP